LSQLNNNFVIFQIVKNERDCNIISTIATNLIPMKEISRYTI